MTEEEFNEKKFKFNQLYGRVNMALREKKLTLEEALKINDVTLEEFDEMGMGYDEKKNSIVYTRYVSYKDFKSREQDEQTQEVSIINNSDKSVQMADIFKNQDLAQLKTLINNYDVLLEMIEVYKTKVTGDAPADTKFITIELPFEEEKDYRKTYRVNKVIAKQFEEFCNEHKEFTVKDLISMALKEYMRKYRK